MHDKSERVLVLRVCRPDMASPFTTDFRWPESGPVEAPDWSPVPECGNGLHGWRWGEGSITGNVNAHLLNDPKSRWLVVEVDAKSIVELQGKVKFPRGEVVFVGDREAAVAYLVERAPLGKAIAFATATAGYGGTATAGESGTATAGYGGTATAGESGTATAGDGGTATAGDGGTATAGYGGTATAGEGGTVAIRWWDEKRSMYRVAVAEVGENGIEPRVPYFVEVVNGKPTWRKR